MKKGLKVIILKIHHWFGLAMCVLFVTWFMSGFVMLYADFPQFSKKDRLQHSLPLAINRCNLPPAQLGKLLNADTAWSSIRMTMLLTRPVFILQNKDGDLQSVYADNGNTVKPLNPTEAEQVAMQYFQDRYRVALTEKVTDMDQWIPHTYYLIHMPIYRITMNDPAETMIYISSKTGEIVQLHNHMQRLLSWFGPIIHWIYPRELIIRRQLWTWVVIILSSLGIVASLSGITLGFIRLKKKKGDKFYSSPYKQQWFKWHHYTGFVFGLVTFTWVFSGLLSMSPGNWSPEIELTELESKNLQGGKLELKSFGQPVNYVLQQLPANFNPSEVELNRFQGQNYYIAYNSTGKSIIVKADSQGALQNEFSISSLINAFNKLQGKLTPVQASLLHAEDNYYYSKHNNSKLPVLRIKYKDAAETWYYIDPANGEMMLKNNRLSRVNRWVYHGLHSLDFFNLQHKRPLWDIVIVFLLVGGTSISVTGLVLAVKRIKK